MLKFPSFSQRYIVRLVLLELSTNMWIGVDDTLLLIFQHKGFSFLSKVTSISLQILSIVYYFFLGNIYYYYLHILEKIFVDLVGFHIMSTILIVLSYQTHPYNRSHVQQTLVMFGNATKSLRQVS